MRKVDFTCTYEERNIDRVLFDKLNESINLCVFGEKMWIYFPTVDECNKVIGHCADRLTELSESNIDLEDKLEMERLSRVVLKAFVDIQKFLLGSNK